MDTKVAQARKFLEHNDKVQVTVLFRGREMQHQEEGRRVLDAVLEKLADVGKVERPPTMDGKKMTALIMPNKPAAKPKPKPPEEAKPGGGNKTDCLRMLGSATVPSTAGNASGRQVLESWLDSDAVNAWIK